MSRYYLPINEEFPVSTGDLAAHPRTGDMRIAPEWTISGTRLGIPVPTCWYNVIGPPAKRFYPYYVTWFDSKEIPNVSLFAVANPENVTTLDELYNFKLNPRDFSANPNFNNWGIDGAILDRQINQWRTQGFAYGGNIPPTYNSTIRTFGVPSLIICNPVGQSVFDPAWAQRWDLPAQGPDGFEWPPRFPDFYLSQF